MDPSAPDAESATIGAPAPGGAALLILDMINPMDFEGSQALVSAATRAAQAIARLRAEADRLGAPVVYVNDNHGRWHSERERLVELCLDPKLPGAQVARRLRPRRGDYFVIKPEFSGFYATNLPVLLPKLGVSRIVLTGVAADVCVLFTAADAHMRGYELWTPADALASDDPDRARWALEIMANSLKADVRDTRSADLEGFVRARAPQPIAS